MQADLEAQFQIVEDDLNEALEQNQAEKISSLLSDDWTILESSTGLSNKEQFLRVIKERKLVHSKMKKKVIQVKLYDDFVIVTAMGKNEGWYLDKPFDAKQWVTNIYKKKNSKWICVMTQESPVSCR